MQAPQDTARLIRFGVFEVDLEAGELRKQGVKVRLQEQPFQVLTILLERPGRVVTRDELQKRLWSDDTFVDFETGVNTAIKKIREALGDSADNPRFVETLHRRGYRFIAPVETARRAVSVGETLLRSVSAWATALLVIVIAAALGIWIVQSRKERSEAPLVPVPLTSYPGYEGYPSFSPDGTQVAFQWCTEGPGGNCDIYVKQIGMEPPSRLTSNPGDDFSPAWSPDGKFIAFLRKLSATKTALMLVPQRGGPEQVLAEADINLLEDSALRAGSYLAWTPDSKWLVLPWCGSDSPDEGLFLINLETREARRLTSSRDGAPAFSPDGRTLAFTRGITPELIHLLRLTKDYQPQGQPEPMGTAAESYDRTFGIAWTSNGKEIVYSSGNYARVGLWRVVASVGARPTMLSFASDHARAPAVSRQGNRLAYVMSRADANIWRIDFQGPGQNLGIPVRLIASTREEADPAYSPDGKRIAFTSDLSGAWEIWSCESDGSHPVQLTTFGGPILFGPKWSPDGQDIAFTVIRESNQDIYVVKADGGPPRRLTDHPAPDRWPSWSQDGRSLYFTSNRTSGGGIWKMPAKGGGAVRITRHEGDFAHESADGKFLYFHKGWPAHPSVWRVSVAGGEEVDVLDSIDPDGLWTVGRMGIYFIAPHDAQGRRDICLYRFATGKTSKLLRIERRVGNHIAVSPDERAILYGQFDQAGSDLMLVENFR